MDSRKQVDPLYRRHLPDSAEAATIEEEDIRLAFAQHETQAASLEEEYLRRNLSRYETQPDDNRPEALPQHPRWLDARLHWVQSRPKRRAVAALVVILILFMILDGVLLTINVTRNHQSIPRSTITTHPTLTVTPASARPGQIVLLHISDFSPSAQVLLTRDIQQNLRTDRGSSFVQVGKDGSADVQVLVQDSWKPGNHLLVAEDTHTHFAASASLLVAGNFTAPPPHLQVGTPDEPNGLSGSLNLGAGFPGENTLQSLLLRNTGGSWISWKATSDQPWLATTPQQGVFQDNEGIFVAASREHLAPGNYRGTITVTWNAGKPVLIPVTMSMIAQPKGAAPLPVVEPPVLSFTATDGASDPAPQFLTISNPGVQPLNWSLNMNIPQNLFGQYLFGQGYGSWLHTNATSGRVAPGSSEKIKVSAQSQQFLPGVYGGILIFSASSNAPEEQPVAVVLTVQQRCGVITNPGSVALTLVVGQHASLDQSLDMGETPGCADVTNWQAFAQASWLKLTPVGGQLRPNVNLKSNLQVDARALAPGTYNGLIDLVTEFRSQTLMVQLTLISPPAKSPVKTTVISPATPVTTATAAPVTPGATPVTPVTPVSNPCTLQVNPTSVTFVATLLQQHPPAQSVTLHATGNCAQPVSWTGSVDSGSQQWLQISPTSGTGSSSGTTLLIQVNTSGMVLGNYSGQISLVAVDPAGKATQGSPQIVSVTLNVIL